MKPAKTSSSASESSKRPQDVKEYGVIDEDAIALFNLGGSGRDGEEESDITYDGFGKKGSGEGGGRWKRRWKESEKRNNVTYLRSVPKIDFVW